MQTTRRDEFAAVMTPVVMVASTSDSTESALAAMDAMGRDFIPVVDGAGEFAGIILRRGVERGCRAMGHSSERCMVLNHLKRGVRSANVDEAARLRVSDLPVKEPVIVLGDLGKPIGFLDPAS